MVRTERDLRPGVVDIAGQLISFNTTVPEPGEEPCQEIECQQYIASLLEAAGFEVDVWEPDVQELKDHPAYRAGQNWRGRPIVAGRLRGAGGGRSLILNGHIDTVPSGPLGEWSNDPWTPTLVNGRLYGRGACDMKGGVAAMLDAALAAAAGPRLAGDLFVVAVTDEEINGMGTIAAIRRGYRADAVLVPEPTNLDICVAFRGILVGEIKVVGRKGHVEIAQPHWSQGGAVNAIHEMLRVLGWLFELNGEWRQRPDKLHPLCSPGQIHVTTIAGGDFQANVPERCRATINVCYVPGEEDATGYGSRVKAEIERHLARMEYGWLASSPPSVSWEVDYPPVETSGGSPLVKELAQTIASHTAGAPRTVGVDTWDDTASWIFELGIPSVSCGPGSNDQAHTADEYVEVSELESAAKVIGSFVRNWCGARDFDRSATRWD